MKTAKQRLAEMERQQILLVKKVRSEEARKTSKVGEYVRAQIPQLEKTSEFLAWLSTDIDRALFGVPLVKKEKRAKNEKQQKVARPTHVPSSTTDQELQGSTIGHTRKPLSPGLQERFKTVTTALPITSPMTGGAGDIIRARLGKPL